MKQLSGAVFTWLGLESTRSLSHTDLYTGPHTLSHTQPHTLSHTQSHTQSQNPCWTGDFLDFHAMGLNGFQTPLLGFSLCYETNKLEMMLWMSQWRESSSWCLRDAFLSLSHIQTQEKTGRQVVFAYFSVSSACSCFSLSHVWLQ